MKKFFVYMLIGLLLIATHYLYNQDLGAVPFLLAAAYFYFRAYQQWKTNKTCIKSATKKHT